MQTFRDCERQLEMDVSSGTNHPCSNPHIFADLLCGPISSTDSPMTAGATRALMYGGGHLQYTYNVAIINSDEMPCDFEAKVITAVVVLPLLEDDLTPAYLPNLAIARSQLSVVHSTQGDTDENILYWNSKQLYFGNISCLGSAEAPCEDSPSNCAPAGCDLSNCRFVFIRAFSNALHGRHEVTTRIKVKRRLKEREALFLLTEFVHEVSSIHSFNWPVRRTVYHRYAVRPSR